MRNFFVALVFFNQSYNVFIKVLIVGAGLIVAGIVLKILSIGVAVREFFAKFQKKDTGNIIKKEKVVTKKKISAKKENEVLKKKKSK